MRTLLVTIAFAIALAPVETAEAQGGRRPVRRPSDPLDVIVPAAIGSSIGANLASIANDAERFLAATREGSAEIEKLRVQFWSQYPDGPARAKAEAAFSQALFAKDLYHVNYYLFGGEQNPTMQLFMKAGPLDGGIRPLAKPAYLEWITEIREKVAVPGTYGREFTFSRLASILPQAMLAESDAYAKYKAARDWAEFALVGRTPAVNTEMYVKTLLNQYANAEGALAARQYDELLKAVGIQPLDRAARAVQAAPKDKNGLLTEEGLAQLRLGVKMASPGQLDCTEAQKAARAKGAAGIGPCDEQRLARVERIIPAGWGIASSNPWDVFEALVAREDPRTYVRTRILQYSQSLDETTYDRWVAAYGERAVFDVAAVIQQAPTRHWGGLVDTTPFGYARKDVVPEVAFAGILAARDPKGAARAFIAFSSRDMAKLTPQIINDQYAALVAIRGEQAVLDAVKRISAVRSPIPRAAALGEAPPVEHVKGLLNGTLEVTTGPNGGEVLYWKPESGIANRDPASRLRSAGGGVPPGVTTKTPPAPDSSRSTAAKSGGRGSVPVEPAGESSAKTGAATTASPKPSPDRAVLRSLVGEYAGESGLLRVRLSASGRLFAFGPDRRLLDLEPEGDLRFTLKGTPGATMEFHRDASGTITELVYEQNGSRIVARRNGLQPNNVQRDATGQSAGNIDRTTLRLLAGRYRTGDTTITVALGRGDTLTYRVPRQPAYSLQPAGGLRFTVVGVDGAVVEFQRDAEGGVVGLVSRGLNGTVTATRTR